MRTPFALALLLADACAVPGGSGTSTTGPASGTSAPGASPASSTAVCDPANIQAGAPEFAGVAPCPLVADVAAIGTCVAGGHAALVGVTGYATVQAAIDAASPGATVVVCPGTHEEEITVGDGKILSAADPTPDATILSQHVAVDAATLEGLTISFRVGWPGPSEAVATSGAVTLECVTGSGAGRVAPLLTHSGDETLTVRYSTFHDNETGAIRMAFGAAALVIEDSTFADNIGNGSDGPAVFAWRSVTIRRSAFTGNRTDGSNDNTANGGAIAVETTPGIPTADPNVVVLIEDSLFEGNEAESRLSGYGGSGGALFTNGVGTTEVHRSIFRNNYAVGVGGAIASWTGSVILADSTIEGNTCGTAAAVDAESLVVDRTRYEGNNGTRSYLGGRSEGGVIFSGTDHVAAYAFVGNDVVAWNNTGAEAAVWLEGAGTFACTCCDFGTGASNNAPVDLVKDGVPTADLGTDSSF